MYARLYPNHIAACHSHLWGHKGCVAAAVDVLRDVGQTEAESPTHQTAAKVAQHHMRGATCRRHTQVISLYTAVRYTAYVTDKD